MGSRTPGRACFVVRGDCQKTTSRPRARVSTSWERFSLARSSTRSIAGPRRVQDRTAWRSSTSTSSGQSTDRWQKTLLVRGHASLALSTTPSPRGSRMR